MRAFDRWLQRWRFRAARPWVPPQARVLDIGCFQGEFFQQLGDRIRAGVGYDPCGQAMALRNVRIVPEAFSVPSSLLEGSFDAVVMLATLEHIVEKKPFVEEFWRLLEPGGRVILTVPSPFVDRIVDLLRRLRFADGMSIDEHHGFSPTAVPALFCARGFQLEHWSRFQLGLNNLFVFRKPLPPAEVVLNAATCVAGQNS
jgi:SAM-dependent methyltransferase